MTTSTLPTQSSATSCPVFVNGMTVADFKRFYTKVKRQHEYVAEAYRRQASRDAIAVAWAGSR